MSFAVAKNERANVMIFGDQNAARHLRYFKQCHIAWINGPFTSIDNVETGFSQPPHSQCSYVGVSKKANITRRQ